MPLLFSRAWAGVNQSLIAGTVFLSSFGAAQWSHASAAEFVEFIKDDAEVQHLNCAANGVFSPDDQFFYVTSYCDSAINIFARDGLTGKLAFVGDLVADEDVGTGVLNRVSHISEISTEVSLDYVEELFFNSQQDRLYANTGSTALGRDNALVYFDRDTNTGAISYHGEYPFAGQLSHATNILMVDDRDFYAVTDVENEEFLEFFNRSNDDVFTWQQEFTGPDPLLSSQFFCQDDIDIDISPNQRLIYTTDSCASNLQLWQRDVETGELLRRGGIQEGTVDGVPSRAISQLNKNRLSHDGKYLYAIVNDGVSVFKLSVDLNVTTEPAAPELVDGKYRFDVVIQNNANVSANDITLEFELEGITGAVIDIPGTGDVDADTSETVNAFDTLAPGAAEIVKVELSLDPDATAEPTFKIAAQAVQVDDDEATNVLNLSFPLAQVSSSSSDASSSSSASSESSSSSTSSQTAKPQKKKKRGGSLGFLTLIGLLGSLVVLRRKPRLVF